MRTGNISPRTATRLLVLPIVTIIAVAMFLAWGGHGEDRAEAASGGVPEISLAVTTGSTSCPGGFDPARDIAAITVNRWPHGYAYSVDAESGDVAWDPEYWRHERHPWVDARQRVGNITFAGTDAASNAMTETAIEEAHRAVHGLVSADAV